MDEFEAKVCFKRSVWRLYKLYKLLRLLPFTYNRVTNRIAQSSHKKQIFTLVLVYFGLTSLVLSSVGTAAFVRVYYVSNGSALIHFEEVLISTRLLYKIFKAFIFAVSYYVHRETFVETINRLIILFERVQRLTNDESLFYPGRLRKFIVLRLVLFALAWVLQTVTFHSLTNTRRFFNFIWFVHRFTLLELTFWAHLYGNLALTCFYHKMNNLLSVLCAASNERRIKRRIREIASISYEIHRVKQKFNEIFNTLHAVCFLGLFSDITCIYKLLKLAIVVGLEEVHVPGTVRIKFTIDMILSGTWASYNMYLNGDIAETLVQSERIFRRKLLTMSSKHDVLRADPDQQREIDLVLMQHNIQNLATKSFKLFEIDHGFIFHFITNVVVCHAILTLQLFASDYVTATVDRLKLLQETVTDT